MKSTSEALDVEHENQFHLNARVEEFGQPDEFKPQYFEFGVQGISLTTVCILGLCANCICLVVMSRPALKKGQCSSVNALLTSMASVDIIVLFCRQLKYQNLKHNALKIRIQRAYIELFIPFSLLQFVDVWDAKPKPASFIR